ncbi:uncharacterized protein LOC109608484 [Aethina tumida]|uniref:uncharacterized protein LOC109608484 n=1 Tax=Aethina tumida TaxID=116153 RepID=UPI0021491629|nr:uncharacterized protein LOC109608484 [Aethina tumida]
MRYQLLFTILFAICPAVYLLIPNSEGINIPLKRHKTPREEYMNAPNIFEKYGISFDVLHKKHHNNNRTNDSIALYRYLDNEFYGEIVIGHPGQKLKVAFDTAWSLSWVLSSQCNFWKTPGCWFHNKYDHQKSSEYKPDGRPYKGIEDSYTLKGFYSYDNISFAHSNVTNQSFVEMVSVPWTFLLNKAEGILGLGPKTDSYTPFFYTLLAQNKIKKPLFSIYLNGDTKSLHGGNIMLGYIEHRHIHKNPQKKEDTIKYLPLDVSAYWQFSVDKIMLSALPPNNKDKIVYCDNGCKAIVDTSSNAIIGPANDIYALNNVIKAKSFVMNRYSVDCSSIKNLPEVNFLLGGQNFTLKGSDYVTKLTVGPTTFCMSAFQPSEETLKDMWIFGGAFLKKYYSIYDLKERMIGFVRAA